MFNFLRPLKVGMTCWAIIMNSIQAFDQSSSAEQYKLDWPFLSSPFLAFKNEKIRVFNFRHLMSHRRNRDYHISQKECPHPLPLGPGFHLSPSKLFYHIPVARESPS